MPPERRRPLHVAALVKQIPAFEQMRLGPDRRLQRDGLAREMSAYCRRAVAQGVALARASGGSCTVVTLGPPAAVDVLREAITFGADAGVHVCDPAFAGSDTLATARALAAAIRSLEHRADRAFDLVLAGRNSLDADTGQVGPQLAELLDRPFATGVKRLEVQAAMLACGLEHDDGWVEATVALPAVVSTAERLIDPCKITDPAAWVPADDRIRVLGASDLGDGPWGQAGSPTAVAEITAEHVDRLRRTLGGPVHEQVDEAVAILVDRGALGAGGQEPARRPVAQNGGAGPVVAVVAEPDRDRLTAELLSVGARLADDVGGRVVAIVPVAAGAAVDAVALDALDALGSAGADEVVVVAGAEVEEDVAAALAAWAAEAGPWAILAGSTAWGREVAARAAAALGAGLTGDAVGLSVRGGRLLARKPAFGGSLVATITASSPVQMATVRPGAMAIDLPRAASVPGAVSIDVKPRGRVVVDRRTRDDDVELLATAEVVVGVGVGVDPADYGALAELRELLGAELAATRKVTDRGWMPHARQVGITGHSISPRLFVSIGASGKYNHTVGIRSAATVLAVNRDPDAPVFGFADVGIVGDWHEVVPLLAGRVRDAMASADALP